MSVSEAIALNNLAVSYLQSDNTLKEAAETFRGALESVQTEYNRNQFRLQRASLLRTRTQDRNPCEQLPPPSTSCISESLSSLQQEEQTSGIRSHHLPEDFSFSSFASTDSEQEDDTATMMDLDGKGQDTFVPPIDSVPVLGDLLRRTAGGAYDHTSLHLFDRALTISDNDRNRRNGDDDAVYDEIDNAVTTAIVMYNMGLVHHGRGMSRGKSKYLAKAAQLYQMSLHMIQQAMDGQQQENMPEVSLLLLANLNNLAQIHSNWCRTDKTKLFLDGMRTVLTECSYEDFVGEEDYILFYMNILQETNVFAFATAPAA